MSKWNLIVDVARCDNCRLCFLAVKDEYIGNDFPGVSAAQPAQGANWLDIKRKERGTYPLVQARFLPVMCDHCEREAWPGPCRVARQAVAANTGRVLRLQVLGNENDCRESRPGGKQAA